MTVTSHMSDSFKSKLLCHIFFHIVPGEGTIMIPLIILYVNLWVVAYPDMLF